ncbi:MAG: radical SAM protein [Acidobacteria bacterium]|jgi:putative pyruvate formate lyase activating enzyme|nr:radical SAM protein [Acidobacteriota bacterium]
MNGVTKSWRAGYVRLLKNGELEQRAQKLGAMLTDCEVCPRSCRVDRRRDVGECATGSDAVIASWNPHHGEEPVISCRRGSGTVFLANCNLRCVFCQNHDISQQPRSFAGQSIADEELASIFLELQDRGCHNINWVSPSHQVPQLVRALQVAATRGLSIPIVYNTNGYDSVETLRLLDGIVDIYMPDLKYADPETGRRLSTVGDYPTHARRALVEMFRQIGSEWELGPEGELRRGLLVRMLVLPGDLAGIEENLAWIASTLSPEVAISLLAQYRPAHRALRSPDLGDIARGINREEWRSAVTALEKNMSGDRHHVQGVWL